MAGVREEVTTGADGHRASVVSEPFGLSPTEARLFAELAQRPGTVVAKHELLRRVWGDDAIDPHVVEVTIGRLRRRLGSAGPVIETVRRRGYVLRPDASGARSRAI